MADVNSSKTKHISVVSSGAKQPKIPSVWVGGGVALPSYYIQINESPSLTGRLNQVQADTSGVNWSEMSVGESRIFQSIAYVNDVIFGFKIYFKNAQSTSMINTLLAKVSIPAWKKEKETTF